MISFSISVAALHITESAVLENSFSKLRLLRTSKFKDYFLLFSGCATCEEFYDSSNKTF